MGGHAYQGTVYFSPSSILKGLKGGGEGTVAPPFMGWGGEQLSSFPLSSIFFNCQMRVDGTTLMGQEELVLLHKQSLRPF